jgi:hypothetical protein
MQVPLLQEGDPPPPFESFCKVRYVNNLMQILNSGFKFLLKPSK